MEAEEATADALAESSEPFGFADVRVLAIAERARIEHSLCRASANGRPRPGHIRISRERPPDFLFRPPYWMVIADPGA